MTWCGTHGNLTHDELCTALLEIMIREASSYANQSERGLKLVASDFMAATLFVLSYDLLPVT